MDSPPPSPGFTKYRVEWAEWIFNNDHQMLLISQVVTAPATTVNVSILLFEMGGIHRMHSSEN